MRDQADQARRQRDRRVLIVVVVAVVVAAVVAGGYWGTRKQTSAAPPSMLRVRADGPALVLGRPSAAVKVEVYEDFGCTPCRQLEQQTRGFLHADAAAGKVVVVYHAYEAQPHGPVLALNAWGRVLTKGTPKQALAFHDALFDQQPGTSLQKAAARAGVPASITATFGTEDQGFLASAQAAATKQKIASTPTVLVDGVPLTAGSVDDLVEQLQRKIAAG